MTRKLFALALAGLAIAPTKASANPGQVYYECDTTPGHYSKVTVDLSPDQTRFSGDIQPNALYRDTHWTPLAAIRMMDADGRSAGVKLAADVPREAVVQSGAALELRIVQTEHDQLNEEKVGSTKLGQNIPFDISVDGDRISVRIGNVARDVTLKLGAARKIEISCSTGDFEFRDVSAGSSLPAP